MENNGDIRHKIRTQGMGLVLIGILAFVTIIGMTLGAYKIFIVERVKMSEEFHTASYYVVHSESLQEKLLSPIESVDFDDIQVSESGGYGVCNIYFNLVLEDKLTQELEVGLVKVSDFWIVYDAVLDPGMPSETMLVSTYQKILLFLEKIDFQEWEIAGALLDVIKHELRQSALEDYLTAKLSAAIGTDVYALQLLNDLEARVRYSKLAVMNEKALLHYNRQDYDKAIGVLNAIEVLYADEYGDGGDADTDIGLFDGLPKDPFIASLEPENVLASARKLLALTYNAAGEYQLGVEWADKAIAQAERIESSVIRSSSVYLKALNLYSLGRYEEAEREFSGVISDIDSPNLSQKSWSYYFKADIAARFSRDEDALDYYEMAVTLEPANALVRKGAVEYLMGRSYAGDLEIALGMALRGVDYGVQKDVFKELASRLYARLGMADKTKTME